MSERRTASSASPAVGRALDVLLHLAGRSGPVRASALARDLEMPRSSLYHILAVLVDRGFVTYVPEEQAYGLGVASFEIGSAYLRHEPLKRLARPILRNLSSRLGQSVHLGILYGAETVYLLKERPPRGPHGYTDATPVTDVGVRLPAHLTANGRAILAHSSEAHLRAVFPRPGDLRTRTGRGPRSLTELRNLLARDRERGWSEEVELVSDGLRSIGVPAFDHNERPIAAVSSTWRRHHHRHETDHVRDILQQGAARLTAAVAGHAPQAHGTDGTQGGAQGGTQRGA